MQRVRIAAGSSLALLVILGQACGPSAPEKGVIDGFFRAARARDAETLGGLSLVAFDPASEGIVESCTVATVTPEQREPLRLTEPAAGHGPAAAEAAARVRALAQISINNPAFASTSHANGFIDPSLYAGTVVTKDYTVSARMRTPSNQQVEQMLVVTLQRVILQDVTGAATRLGRNVGRWIVTRVQVLPPSR